MQSRAGRFDTARCSLTRGRCGGLRTGRVVESLRVLWFNERVKTKDLSKYRDLFSGYGELRLQETTTVGIAMVDGTIMANNQSTAGGISARVFKSGAWGFASNPDTGDDSIRTVVKKADENAAFMDSRLRNDPYKLPSRPGSLERSYGTEKARKSRREMIEFMQELDRYITSTYPGLSSRTLSLQCLDMEKTLMTADGTCAYSRVPRTLCFVVMNTERDGAPCELLEPFGFRGHFEDVFSEPKELFSDIDTLHENLQRKADGIYAEAGYKECILDADLAGVLAHEAIGHTTEADIVIGGSVAAEYIGEAVASPLITIVDYAYEAFGAPCPVPVHIDDEGVTAEDTVLIDEGVLKGFMHNRETAVHFDTEPTGNARAYRFSDEPIIRMRNTTINPGESKLNDMIASIDDGYYLKKFNNGQADSTSEFMFGITSGYEIKNGKIGRGIRDTTISGVAFDTLKTVSMVSDDMSWSCAGMCGKKQPIPVGMGGPAIKCKVNIGGR